MGPPGPVSMFASRRFVVSVALALGASGGAAGSVRSVVAQYLPPTDRAARSVNATIPESVQAAYDAARDLQEALRVTAPRSAGCIALRAAVLDYASGVVDAQDGIDRPSASIRAAGAARANAASKRIATSQSSCVDGAEGTVAVSTSIQPASGEAFFGTVAGPVPAGTDTVEIQLDRTTVARPRPQGGSLRVSVSAVPGRHDLRVVFRDKQGTDLGHVESANVWLLPAAARVATPFHSRDAALEQRLASEAKSFSGYAGLWVQNLRTGRAAGYNAGARFPAASTVKLGLLAGSIAALGPNPQASRYFEDLREMAGWSSNLATNRLVQRLGSGCDSGAEALSTEGLRRLGAKVSTFTGCYIVGTELQPAMPAGSAVSSPPLETARVTSAQDLSRMLYSLQAAAAGVGPARQETRLTQQQARLALGLLLASQQVGDNRSNFLGGLPAGTLVAQKNGWLRRARHGVALVFGPSGPSIVAMVTYRDSGVSPAEAAAFGARIARLAGG